MYNKDSKHIQLEIDKHVAEEEKYYSSYGEYAVNCGNIIFLPFNALWEFIIMWLVVVNTLTLIYNTIFRRDEYYDLSLEIIFYLIHITYFFDTVLSILHKKMVKTRKSREYEPKFIGYIIVDVISLLPIYELYLLIKTAATHPTYDHNMKVFFRGLTCFRLYRVYDYFHKISYNAGINQLSFICIGQYVKLVILTEFISAIWYRIGCWKCGRRNWTNNLNEKYFNPKSAFDWLIICTATIGNAFAHNSNGIIGAENTTERIILILTMLSGFVIHFMVYFGQLTWAYVKTFRRQLTFVQTLTSIKTLLKDLNVDKDWQDKTVEYYGIFWAKRQGIKHMPSMFYLLPTPLQKEVTVDIYWEVLRHSHLFQEEDMPFKRAISLVMKSEFFLAGDYVYKVNELKSKMVYIVNGILQILTDEDEESPIISFSSGTILGEQCCIYPQKSATHVRSATYSELHTLSFLDLQTVLKNYPKKRKRLYEKLKIRLETAKLLDRLKRKSAKFKRESLKKETGIKWIKYQWQYISEKTAKKNEPSLSHSNVVSSPNHTSKHLDMLVLSKAVELKIKVICLRGSCPFIFGPNSSFLVFCKFVVLAATILQAIIVPYHAAFVRTMPPDMYSFCFLLDLIYWMDIYLKLSTALKYKHTLLSKSTSIIMKQFMRASFIVDVLATVPVDYFLLTSDVRLATVLKINRVFKIYQLFAYIISLENDIWVSDIMAKIIKYVAMYVLFGYWMACFSYMNACYYEKCTPNEWFAIYMEQRGYEYVPPFEAFLKCILYVFSTYLVIGLADSHHLVVGDLVINHIFIVVAYFVYSFWIASLTASLIIYSEKQSNYRHYYSSTIKKVEATHMPTKLKAQFKRMLQFWWYYNRNEELVGENGILKDATDDLRNKILKERIIKCLKSSLLFSLCDDIMLNAVAKKCTLKTLPPNTEIVTVKSRSNWIHIILRGYLYRSSAVSGDKDRKGVILKPGEVFPLFGGLFQIVTIVNIISITSVELISITYIDLMDIFHENPETANILEETIKSHMQMYETQLLCRSGRLPDMTPTEHSLGQGDFFIYKVYDDETITAEDKNYRKPWLRLGKWSFIRYFLMKKTINPQQKLFFYWEFSRVIIIVVKVYLSLTIFNLWIEYDNVIYKIILGIKITSIADLYFRAHCQYYNEKGILVTHPWSTCKNYIFGSFFIDVFSIIPFRFFHINSILGADRKDTVYIFLLLISNSLQLYRVLGLINYFQGSIHNTSNGIKMVKYVCVCVFVMLAATSLFHILFCPLQFGINYDRDTNVVTCYGTSWISHIRFNGKLTPTSLHVIYAYTVVSIYASAFPNVLTVYDSYEIVMFLIITIILFVFRWVVFALMTTAKLGANMRLTLYQERTNAFLRFAESEYIDEDLIKQTVEYYQYNWKKVEGGSINPTLRKFHPNLHAEVVFNLYGPSMELVEIFQGVDSGFFRTLGILLEIQHFKKDSEIIRINDVQGLVFIVYKGKVDIKVAGMNVTTLGNGAMFGCFEKKGKTRHTVSATAKVHLELLVIDSLKFHKVISGFPEVSKRLNDINRFGYEYVDSRRRINFLTAGTGTYKKKSVKTCLKPFYAIARKLSVTIKHNRKFYKFWEYLMCVHIPHLTTFVFMLYFTAIKSSAIQKTSMIILYVLDGLVVIKMYIRFNVTYTDSESGLIVYSRKLITLNYLKSIIFWIDIFSIIPLELIILLVPHLKNIDEVQYFMSNRLLRLYYLLKYYQKSGSKLKVRAHLRWTFLIYWLAVMMELMTCFWWIVACKNGKCKFAKVTVNNNQNVVEEEPGIVYLIIAFKYVVNLFTMTSMIDGEPRELSEILTTIAILLIFQYTIIYLSGEFASLVGLGQYLMNNYEFEIRQLRMYLKGRELSTPLVDKVWTYNLQLWRRQRGDGIPKIITEAPAYLKQDLMKALYGSHLNEHFLFINTHDDFLRQLVVHLQRFLFFPGNYLAEKGDIDGSMYFIHDGEIEVCDKHGANYVLSHLLEKGNSFGEEQGLYNTPHTATYKARTIVDALVLKMSDWKYLLEWYPASSREIFLQAAYFNIRPKGFVNM